MSLVSDYVGFVRPKIDAAVSAAMYMWVDPFKSTIDLVSAEFDGPRSRPMLFGEGSYEEEVGSNYVTITNVTPLQGTDYGIPEVVFVEAGMANYNMPGPRPFMEKAGKQFAEGAGTRILQSCLDVLV